MSENSTNEVAKLQRSSIEIHEAKNYVTSSEKESGAHINDFVYSGSAHNDHAEFLQDFIYHNPSNASV